MKKRKFNIWTLIASLGVVGTIASSVIFSIFVIDYEKNIYSWDEVTHGKLSEVDYTVITRSEVETEEEISKLYSLKDKVHGETERKELSEKYWIADSNSKKNSLKIYEYFDFKIVGSESENAGETIPYCIYCFDSTGELLFSMVDRGINRGIKVTADGVETHYVYASHTLL